METLDIKYYINASVRTSGCNLKCDYCYLAHAGYKNDKGTRALRYPLEQVLQAFSKERLGGTCYITLIGDGETFLPNDIEALIMGLLEAGHYISITTNGTISNKIKNIVEWAKQNGKERRISFTLSLHYLELQRLGLLDAFAELVWYLKLNKISFTISLTMGELYIPIVEEIKEYCDIRLEVMPAVNFARDKKLDGTIDILSGRYSKDEYYNAVKKMESEGFEYRWKDYAERPKGFCYAGSWFFEVDLTRGLCTQCFGNDANKFNFYENISEELPLEPVGYRCKLPY